MESVIVSDFGVMLGKTGERLVVRGPQLFLPIDIPPRPPLQFVMSSGNPTRAPFPERAKKFASIEPRRRRRGN